jgi:hypothetical protein
MIGITDNLKADIASSLLKAGSFPDGMIPLQTMDRHYCSLQDKKDGNYFQIMKVEVDGKSVYVYFKA